MKNIKKTKISKKNRKLNNKILKFLIITGEKSGELLALDVVKKLKELRNFQFIGTGGELLKKENMELIEEIQNMEVIGIWEAIKAYPFLKKLLRKIIQIVKEQNIEYVLLVDYPGFNLRLAEALKKINKNIKIFYYVSPQIWAWNYKRIYKIKKNIDKMYVLFEFEEKIYQKENIPVLWVGHPIRYRIPKEIRKQPKLQFKNSPIIGILPGSRYSEVTQLLIPMLESAKTIQEKFTKSIFLIATPSTKGKVYEYVKEVTSSYKGIRVQLIPEASLRIMQISDLLIIASGTATLEATYFKKPMIICYKISWFSYMILSLLIKTKYIGLPNLLCKEQVAVELLQNEVTPENIYTEAIRILEDNNYKKQIINQLKQIEFSPANVQPAELVIQDIIKQIL